MIATDHLHYDRDGNYYLLPEWCNYYIDLGYEANRFLDEEEHLVIVISVPTRAYAAAFVSLGVTKACIENPGNLTTQSAHFEHLCSLPIGTIALKKINNNKVREIVLTGSIGSGATKLLTFKYVSDGLVESTIPLEGASTIVALPYLDSEKQAHYKKKKLVKNPDFINAVIGENQVWTLATRRFLDYVLIGNLHILEAEIRKSNFTYKNGNIIYTGALHDIIRIKRFCSNSETYGSDILPASSRNIPQYPHCAQPRLVIFDGASAFNKLHGYLPKSGWIVLLDRTDPNFDTARSTLNQLYYSRKSDISSKLSVNTPESLELMAYLE